MKPHQYGVACCALIAACTAATGMADEAPPITLNPFARPPSVTIAEEKSPTALATSRRVTMDLRATMVGERGSLANVAGKIISPGETVEGFQLLRVYDDRAEFEIQGERVTVYVRPPVDENNE